MGVIPPFAARHRVEASSVRRSAARTMSLPVIAGLVRVADFVLLGAIGLGLANSFGPAAMHTGGGVTLAASLLAAIGASFALARNGVYTLPILTAAATGIRLALMPVGLGVGCLIAAFFFQGQSSLSDRIFPFAWGGAALLLLALRMVGMDRVMRPWTEAGLLARKIAIVGVGELSGEFILRLQEDRHAYRIAGLYDDRLARVPPMQSGIAVRGTVADLVEDSRAEPVDVIVIALPLSAADRIRTIMDQLSGTVADIVLTTDLAGLRFAPSQFDGVGRNPVVCVRETPFKDWRAIQKAALDYGLGVIALLLLSPVMLATAILIKLDSPGPVLFRQPRLGFNNRLFTCFKFRSMYAGNTDLLADQQTTRSDARVTRVGRFIRKYSVDELPQIFNVLNGTMSLVGPRPHAPNTKAADRLFTEVVQKYAARHRVKPGITGWAQINGWRGETARVEQIEQRVACDLYYIENWSLRFDLKILVLTVVREVFSGRAF